MKEIFKVTYQVTDRGAVHPPKTRDFHKPIEDSVNTFLRNNKHAMDLSGNYSFEILDSEFSGWGFAGI